MKLKIAVGAILVLAIVSLVRAAEEEKPKKKKIFEQIGHLFGKFGENSKTKITIISGPKDVKMNRGGAPGKQWIATCDKYEFKLTIEDTVSLKVEELVKRLEKLPVPYISACQAVSDKGEDGIAIYKTLGGASAHGGQTYINMVPGAGSLVVAHEAGHTLEQVARSSDPKILEKWAEVAVADKISVSGYGGDEGGHEDIAEFAMAYAVCLDAGDGKLEFLKELSPRRFAMWEKVLYWPPQTVAKDKEKKGGEEKENAQRNEGKGSN